VESGTYVCKAVLILFGLTLTVCGWHYWSKRRGDGQGIPGIRWFEGGRQNAPWSRWRSNLQLVFEGAAVDIW